MAIVKVGTYRNPPEDITDYEAMVAHLEAYTRQVGNQGMILTEWTNTTNAPKIAMGSYISHGGVLYVVKDEDYVVTTAIDGYQYFRVLASGDTLIIDTVSSVVGYSWNAIYNGLYDVSGNQILPYQFNWNAGTGLYEKWKITNLMQGGGFSRVRYDGVVKCESLAVTGAITALEAITTNGPNKPVNNNDASMPSVGIGGFSYATALSANSFPTVTLGSGGIWVWVAYSHRGISSTKSMELGRSSGGSTVTGSAHGDSDKNGYVHVIGWRIA